MQFSRSAGLFAAIHIARQASGTTRLLREYIGPVSLINSNSDIALSTAADACLRSIASCSSIPGEVEPLNDYDHQKYVWLFNYGSNMNPAKLSKWDIHPQATFRAYVPGRAVRFDTVLKTAEEPSFGNLVRCPINSTEYFGCAHGTLSLISHEELKRLDQSELLYVREEIDAITYGGQRVKALAYTSPREVEEVRPSARYAKLVYCGAVYAGLNKIYIQSLKDFLFPDGDAPNCEEGQIAGEPLPISFFQQDRLNSSDKST